MPEEKESEIRKLILEQVGVINKEISDTYKTKAKNAVDPSDRTKYTIIGAAITLACSLGMWAIDKGWEASTEKMQLIETMKVTQDSHVETLKIIGNALENIRTNQIKNQERIETLIGSRNKNEEDITDLRIKVYELQKVNGIVSTNRSNNN